MYPLVATIIILNIISSFNCVTVYRYKTPEIVTKSKTELTPMHITCGFNDIIIITAPIINQKDVLYYLYKPNGDVVKLEIPHANYQREKNDINNKINGIKYNFIIVKRVKTVDEGGKSPLNDYKVFNVNTEVTDNNRNDLFYENVNELNENDFMIGPVSESDHGNWVLSLYCKDYNDEWMEMFQYITIEITESVPANVQKLILRRGDTFRFKFPYPIKGITSCELKAPRTTFDRCYDRDQNYWENCAYIVRNVTREDAGMWGIIGVGRIVYETKMYLEIT